MNTRVAIALASTVTACTHPPKTDSGEARSAALSKAQLSTMDSATIERLCQRADSVRAGVAACVLRDQSQPLLGPPVAPPPR